MSHAGRGAHRRRRGGASGARASTSSSAPRLSPRRWPGWPPMRPRARGPGRHPCAGRLPAPPGRSVIVRAGAGPRRSSGPISRLRGDVAAPWYSPPAAGRRFGGGKLPAPLRGRPLLAYVLDVVAGRPQRGRLVAGRRRCGRRRREMRRARRARRLGAVVERRPGAGALQLGPPRAGACSGPARALPCVLSAISRWSAPM